MKTAIRQSLACLLILAAMAHFLGCSSPEDKKVKFMDKGDRLFSEQAYDRARLEYKNALQIDPEYAPAYLGLGKVMMKLKQFKNAYPAFAKAVELDPENIEARVELGRLLLAGRAADKAGEQADAVLAKDPDHLKGSLLKASVHYVQKAFPQGDEVLLGLYRDGRTDPALYMMLAASAKRRGDMAQVNNYLDEGLEHFPENVDLMLLRVQRDAQEKQWDRVEDGFKKVISLKPGSLKYRLSLAKVLLTRKETQKAEEVLDAAMTLEKNEPGTRIAIARLWLAARQVDKARVLLEQGIETFPDNFDFRLALAQIHMGTRQAQKAEDCLRKALELDPDPAHPQIIKTKLALAKLLLVTSRGADGESLIDQVLKDDPKNLDGHFIKGKIFLSKKDGRNAVTEFRLVVQKRPEEPKGHLNLAAAHLLSQEPDLAMEVLKSANKAMPENNELLTAMARLNLMKKDLPAAEENLKQAVENTPRALGPRIALGDFYMASKNFDKALAQYRTARDHTPGKPIGYLKAASVLGAQELHQEAMDELRLGYGSNPDSAPIISGLARGYLAMREPKKAEALCRERLDANPKEPFTWNLLGNVLLAGNKMDQALTAYEKAAELTPQWDAPYDNMARIFLARGEKEKAVKRFHSALEKNPKNMGAWMVLGSIYTRDKDHAAAARTYEQAFEKNPRLWAAANNYAFTMSEHTDDPAALNKALVHAKKALVLNPGSGVILDTLGWIQFKLGDTDQALEHITKALEQHPDSAILNYHMGMIKDRQGKILDAKSHLEKSLAGGEDFPGSDQARRRLAEYGSQSG